MLAIVEIVLFLLVVFFLAVDVLLVVFFFPEVVVVSFLSEPVKLPVKELKRLVTLAPFNNPVRDFAIEEKMGRGGWILKR